MSLRVRCGISSLAAGSRFRCACPGRRRAERRWSSCATVPSASPWESSTTKPGRSALSVPRPYSSHEPMLGRGQHRMPAVGQQQAGRVVGDFADCIERTTHRSSACRATFGIQLADLQSALAVLGLNLKRRGKQYTPTRFRCVGCSRALTESGSGCAVEFLVRFGLGSNVSICDGPPFMNRWITRLPRGVKVRLARTPSGPVAPGRCTAAEQLRRIVGQQAGRRWPMEEVTGIPSGA